MFLSLKERVQRWRRILESKSPAMYAANECGHLSKRLGSVTAFGVTINTEMSLNEDRTLNYCLDCLGKMAIQCAWCTNPIFIGDGVTLYIAKKEAPIPEHAIVHDADRRELVGCLRCASTVADMAGIWVPDEEQTGVGHVERTRSIYTRALQSGDGFATGEVPIRR